MLVIVHQTSRNWGKHISFLVIIVNNIYFKTIKCNTIILKSFGGAHLKCLGCSNPLVAPMSKTNVLRRNSLKL